MSTLHPHPHSHIRIIPREQLDGDSYNDSTPTFRSPSLQLPPFPLSDPDSRRGSAHSETSTKIDTTFAQMARRSNKSDMQGVEKPTSGPVPLSGFVVFKTHSSRNRLRNKTWRPGVPIHLLQGEGLAGFHADLSSSPVESVEPAAPPSPQPSQTRSTPFALPKIQTNLQIHREEPAQMDVLGGQQPVGRPTLSITTAYLSRHLQARAATTSAPATPVHMPSRTTYTSSDTCPTSFVFKSRLATSTVRPSSLVIPTVTSPLTSGCLILINGSILVFGPTHARG